MATAQMLDKLVPTGASVLSLRPYRKGRGVEMTFSPTGLTWITAARERAERAAYKLRILETDPHRSFAVEELTEAENELRAAVNHCEDSVRSIEKGEA